MSTIPSLTALAAASFAADDNLIVDDTSLATTKRVEAQNLLDALLRIAAAGGVLMLDATAEKIIIRERGGTAGTDEVQVYHDGSNGHINSLSGYLFVVGAGGVIFGSGSAAVRPPDIFCVDDVGQYAWSNTTGNAYGSTKDTALTRRTAGEVEVTDGSTGRRDLAARTLIARQDGGVIGTDEVQVYHDGSNGYIETKSGTIYFRLSGFNPLAVDASLAVFNVALQCANAYPLSTDTYDLGLTGTRWRNLFMTGYALCTTLVEANTAGSGSPNILTATESRTALTNEGATAENYHTLPTAAAGLDFEFVCQDSDGIRVTANTGDTIRDVATVSATAGYIRSSTIGSVIRLKAINATEWFVVYKQGTWTVDS